MGPTVTRQVQDPQAVNSSTTHYTFQKLFSAIPRNVTIARFSYNGIVLISLVITTYCRLVRTRRRKTAYVIMGNLGIGL